MLDSDTIRFIREEIRRQVNIVLPAVAGETSDVETESIEELFPGMPTITERPVMHPYGFASRAPRGTASVVARVGEHTGNRMVIGHRDKDRPEDLEAGEAALYNENGDILLMKKNDVQLQAKQDLTLEAEQNAVLAGSKVYAGSDAADEPLVLGNVLKTFLGDLIDAVNSTIDQASSALNAIASGPISLDITTSSPEPTFPATAAQIVAATAQLTAAKAQLAAKKAQLLDAAPTNILSQKAFTERGP